MSDESEFNKAISGKQQSQSRTRTKKPKPKEKTGHDGLHMPEWSTTSACYCKCKGCWVPGNQTEAGKCICPQCICGGFQAITLRTDGFRYGLMSTSTSAAPTRTRMAGR